MIIFGFLIFILVYFNFFIKKNIYYSVLIGNILLLIGFFTIWKMPINVLNYQNNYQYYLGAVIVVIFLINLKIFNQSLRLTKSKEQVIEIINFILKDKNLKILFLGFLSMFFLKAPLLGLIFLIFISTFLNISKLGMILLPLMYTLLGQLALIFSNGEFFDYQIINALIILFVFYYAIMYIFYLIENNIYSESYLKRNLIDLLFTIILLVINIGIILIIYNLASIKMTVFISAALTIIIGRYLIYKFSFFHNEDQKVSGKIEINQIDALVRTNIPYFFIFFMGLVVSLLFIILAYKPILGMIIFIAVNIMIQKKVKVNTIKINQNQIEQYIQLGIICTLVLINGIILIQVGSGITDLILADQSLGTTYGLNPLMFMITNLQSFVFIPILAFSSQFIKNTQIEISPLFQAVIYIQVFLGILSSYFLSFIFSLETEEIFSMVTILLIVTTILEVCLIYFI